MSLIQAAILGVIEGLTEFLPVSSTGHLILAQYVLGIPATDFAKTFEIAIQLGAILAVIILYWNRFWKWDRIFKLAAAFIPTGIIGLAVYKLARAFLLGNDVVVIASLFVGGIVLIIFERIYGKRENAAGAAEPAIPDAGGSASYLDEISYPKAVGIGFAQAVAIIPGVSRSGATIVGGMLMGISRAAIVEFSFLLAVPTMLAATGLSLYKTSAAFTPHEWTALGIGFVVAFLLAMPIVKWFLGYVRSHSFTAFGWYRIALAILFTAWLVL